MIIRITMAQMMIMITIIWIIVRAVTAAVTRKFSIKREFKLLLVYICLIVIARFVYFDFPIEKGTRPTLYVVLTWTAINKVTLLPFYFLVDRYKGWLMNVIGNIAMFIPVGIVWPVCFDKLDSIKKTVLAGFGLTLFIELSQIFCDGRHTDIDDLILNTCGVVIGAVILFSIRKAKKAAK
ncbi:VanZ family protein [Butyrivibrio sp.]|uniref:VanZ family protein n=1 Tax=Butyrivibrio sp. TaxID=28121 RepID=UPI0025F104EB|nr:VanZ family protein [Butyrivibrio sp.]